MWLHITLETALKTLEASAKHMEAHIEDKKYRLVGLQEPTWVTTLFASLALFLASSSQGYCQP
jgi:hypothetical protein